MDGSVAPQSGPNTGEFEGTVAPLHWFDFTPSNSFGWIFLMFTTLLTVNQNLSCQTVFLNAEAINSSLQWVSQGREDFAGVRRVKKSCTTLYHPRPPQLEDSPFVTNSFQDGCFSLHNPLWQLMAPQSVPRAWSETETSWVLDTTAVPQQHSHAKHTA